MQGQCYTVNGKSFLNKFSALRCAKQENAFAEFHIPQWHLDAFESVSVKDVVAQSPEYWIDYKIEKLFEIYPNMRLWYSGGTDSDTILMRALQKNKKFHHVLMHIRGQKDCEYIEFDVEPGYQFLKKNPKVGNNVEIYHNTIDDYANLWLGTSPTDNVDDHVMVFYPSSRSHALKNSRLQLEIDLNVEGHAKPLIYAKNGVYYYIYTDGYNEGRVINSSSFYLDGIVPQVAISQVYAAKNFFQTYYPDRNGILTYATLPTSSRRNYHKALGRIVPRTEEISWGNHGNAKGGHPLNLKNAIAMKNCIASNRQDIVEAFFKKSQNILDEFADYQYAFSKFEVDNPVNFGPKKLILPREISRIAFAYRLDEHEIVRVPHHNIFE